MTMTQEGTESSVMRRFYDPIHEHVQLPEEGFYSLVSKRQGAVSALGFGALRGHEITLADALHAKQEVPGAVLAELSPSREDSIRDYVEVRSEQIASHVAKTTRAHAIDSSPLRLMSSSPRGMYIDTLPDGEPDHTLLATRVLAAIAHYGVRRRNDKAYITHPEAVASIAEAGWRRQNGPTVYTDKLRTLKAISYLHDAYEDTVDVNGVYLSKPIIASPLVVDKLARQHKFAEADVVSRAVFLLCHNKGLTGKMPYSEYIDRGARVGGASFIMTKAADIQHNSVIDADNPHSAPDPARVWRRRQKYERSRQALLSAANNFSSMTNILTVHAIFDVQGQEMDNYVRRLRPVHLRPDEFAFDS